MAQSMIKQLDKIELIEPDPVFAKVNFKFPKPVRAGDVVLTLKIYRRSSAIRSFLRKSRERFVAAKKWRLLLPTAPEKRRCLI